MDDLFEAINNSNDKRAATSARKAREAYKSRKVSKNYHCDHGDLGSMGYQHGTTVKCPDCGELVEVW